MTRSEEETWLKANLLERIADGTMPADAARELRIGWRDLARWKREDSLFAQDFKDAEAALADVLAARAVRVHETTDARSAQVAQNGLKWAAEKYAPQKYGPKIELNDKTSSANLLAILREAIKRVDVVPLSAKAIDAQPVRRLEIEPTPQERHRP